MDADARFDELMLIVRDTDRDKVQLRDADEVGDRVVALVRVELLLTLGEIVADRDGLGIHWQHALSVVRQLSSLSAPLAKKPGVSTSTQAPAPVGSGSPWPAAGVPHSEALFA